MYWQLNRCAFKQSSRPLCPGIARGACAIPPAFVADDNTYTRTLACMRAMNEGCALCMLDEGKYEWTREYVTNLFFYLEMGVVIAMIGAAMILCDMYFNTTTCFMNDHAWLHDTVLIYKTAVVSWKKLNDVYCVCIVVLHVYCMWVGVYYSTNNNTGPRKKELLDATCHTSTVAWCRTYCCPFATCSPTRLVRVWPVCLSSILERLSRYISRPAGLCRSCSILFDGACIMTIWVGTIGRT